jgi:hypothetical protein
MFSRIAGKKDESTNALGRALPFLRVQLKPYRNKRKRRMQGRMSMKIAKIIPLLLTLALIPATAFSGEYGRARIGYLTGDVQIQTADTPEWLPASTNTPIGEGDRIWVPEGGRTEVQVLGGALIRLNAFTSLDTLSLGGESIQFYLNDGHAYINNRKGGIDSVQIDTPLSSISCRDDSLAMIDVAESGATEISVLRGDAYAETRNGKIRVPEGNSLLIREDLTAEFSPLASTGEWEEWNGNRDQELTAGSESLRYLPNELNDYVSDFDENGRWLNTAEYGNVWIPTVSLSLDWAPYRVGRWAWMGGDYTWISYEPWGWAPYHYGRWAFLAGRGWCWVPPRHGAARWAPGYVGWVHTPTYVSWVPLAPGDTYYGHGYYGPGSVNINTISINTTNVSRRFRNIDARNAVTAIHRDTFFHGRRTDFRLHENPFKQRNVGFGPPPVVRPDRMTVSPIIRTIPAAKLPPPKVQQIKPEKIRRERRLVTDERSSVFMPAGPARQMPTIHREGPKRPEQLHKPEQFREIQGKPPIIKPAPSRQPATVRPADGRGERYRLPTTPFTTGTPPAVRVEKPPAIVKPPTEKKPRTTVSPTSTAPTVVPPGTPSSTTGTRPSGQTVERSRIRTVPGEISTGRQKGPVTGAPTRDRSRTMGSQGVRVAPQPVAPQPVAPTQVWRPQQPPVPASTRQPAVRTTPTQIQRPTAVSPHMQQQPAQPVQTQRFQSPHPQIPAQRRQMKPNQPSEQQPNVQQRSGQKPSSRKESGSKKKTSPKTTETQQQTGTTATPPSYAPHGQGRTEVR